MWVSSAVIAAVVVSFAWLVMLLVSSERAYNRLYRQYKEFLDRTLNRLTQK
jgi:uncharacterized membrane protein YccC